jgi:formate dehydrogenase gamma subunit
MFALSKIHLSSENGSDLASRINHWVRLVYLLLIWGVVGLMAVHNILAWRLKALVSLRAKDRTVLRMNRSQRWQHFLLALSFVVLAVTGFALKYPDSGLAWLLGSEETIRRLTHRVAGAVMILLGFYHILYVVASRTGRQMFKDFVPGKKDFLDASTNTQHLLGRKIAQPQFGRFSYTEKLEYWAVIWGTIIMGITGLMIWFKMDVTHFLPRWTVDVATTIHYYEAILACLAIVVWHFYFVIFDPAIYPMNWAFWDGRVSARWYQHEHPLDTQTTDSALPEKDSSTSHQEEPRANQDLPNP